MTEIEWRDAVLKRIDDLIKQRDLYAEALDAISVATPGDDPARVLGQCVRIAQVALGERHG